MMIKRLLLLSLIALLCGIQAAWADTVTRNEVIELAERYASHRWTVPHSNPSTNSAKCKPYNCFRPGTTEVGVAYNWGGFDSIEGFERKIASGAVAGNIYSKHGTQSSYAGIDCSGFVSRVWGLTRKYGTGNIDEVANKIDWNELKPGDAINKKGHIRLFHRSLASGQLEVYEAAGTTNKRGKVLKSKVLPREKGYYPIRYQNIRDGDLGVLPTAPGYVPPPGGTGHRQPSYPPPVITGVSPQTLVAGGKRQAFVIQGSGFLQNSRLEFRDSAGHVYRNRIPNIARSTRLQYNINVGSRTGTWEVRVVTPDGKKSSPARFEVTRGGTIVDPPPPPKPPKPGPIGGDFTITGVSPSVLPPRPAGERQLIKIYGQNFNRDTKLELRIVGGRTFKNRKPKFISDSELHYNINVAMQENTWEIYAVNRGRKVGPVRLEVRRGTSGIPIDPVAPLPVPVENGPSITRVSPSVLPPRLAGERQLVKIYGRNFSWDSKLELHIVGGRTFKDRKPTFISNSELHYNINVAMQENTWEIYVVNQGRKSAPVRLEVKRGAVPVTEPEVVEPAPFVPPDLPPPVTVSRPDPEVPRSRPEPPVTTPPATGSGGFDNVDQGMLEIVREAKRKIVETTMQQAELNLRTAAWNYARAHIRQQLLVEIQSMSLSNRDEQVQNTQNQIEKHMQAFDKLVADYATNLQELVAYSDDLTGAAIENIRREKARDQVVDAVLDLLKRHLSKANDGFKAGWQDDIQELALRRGLFIR